MATYLEGIKMVLKLARTPALKEWTDGTLRVNWDECNTTKCGCPSRDALHTPDSVWECLVRQYATTVYHPAGTAKMGDDDDVNAVLDPLLRVRGVANLRVVDTSSWPTITSGNTNAPAIMVAERAADLIKEALLSA